MRIDFERAGKAGVKAVKRARYFPRQPHEDSVLVTVNEAYIRAAFEDSVTDYVSNWRRRGFRPGHAPRNLLPDETVSEIREFVCAQLATYAVEQIRPKLDPQPFLSPTTIHGQWLGEGDFLVKIWYRVAPHIPDPMQMFDLEIRLEDDPLKMAYAMSGTEESGRQEIAASGSLERLGTGLAMTGAQTARPLDLTRGDEQDRNIPAVGLPAMTADPLSGPALPPPR
ncbi:MAG: trigger factor [bacterium]